MDSNEKMFEMAEYAFAQSWETHRQAFGPILEPAFAENPQVRIPLVAALNHISRREVRKGLELLREIQRFCVYDEDKAAWAFFVGLAFEMAGGKEQMLKWYAEAGNYGHRFHFPYLKLAKAEHEAAQFEKARMHYETAIECLLEASEEYRDESILGASYVNLASCLTMLYRYREAEAAWQRAQSYPLKPGAPATAAILYAAMGNAEKTAEYIGHLKQKYPIWLEHVQTMTEQILSGTHPHFPKEKEK